MTRWHRLFVALVAGVTVLLAGTTAAGSAPHRAVPTCRGLGHVTSGVHAWMDNHRGTGSQLYRGIDQLICSAADHSTVKIKSWYFSDDAVSRHLVADLRIMHRYHHVHVYVLLGRSSSHIAAATLREFRGVATVRGCYKQCIGPDTHTGKAHSKFVTVSRLRQGGTGVVSTSTNFSAQQFGTVESGIFSARQSGVYATFTHQFWAMWHHTGHVGAVSWRTVAPGVAVFFSPSTNSPTHEEMRWVAQHACGRGGSISVTSLQLGKELAGDLKRLRAAGCRVRVLIEHRAPTELMAANHPRCRLLHDKAITVNTPLLREVITGSDDFQRGGLRNDQQTLRIRHWWIVDAYRSQFWSGWTHHGRCLA